VHFSLRSVKIFTERNHRLSLRSVKIHGTQSVLFVAFREDSRNAISSFRYVPWRFSNMLRFAVVPRSVRCFKRWSIYIVIGMMIWSMQ